MNFPLRDVIHPTSVSNGKKRLENAEQLAAS